MSIKYKQLIKLKEINRISSRILTFKRPKWNRLKANTSTKVSKEISGAIYNLSDNFVMTSVWNKIFKNYKELLNTKRKYKYVFGADFSHTKNKFKFNYLSSNLFYFYSPNFLLFLSGFANSKFHARNLLFSKKVSINDVVSINNNIKLNSGDIVKIVSTTSLLKSLKNFHYFFNVSIVEVDIYSSQHILIKNLHQLSEEDIESLMFENIRFF